ncbi:hypothetical protein, partial [Enterobacter asburiae]|uniref:hypothetical protein n=1 Tax=Enterobacter asburiae TaxID=61645 RepID=UPI0019552E6C
HAGGRGFESRPFRHLLKALSLRSGLFSYLTFNYCEISKNPLRFAIFFSITTPAIIFLSLRT